ncbi:MAG: ABC transporter ATP-binding protein [SAR324 cluster bacterium]|nr:ABC transporter ATP-binding protein [SAR324 cluster bacterium]
MKEQHTKKNAIPISSAPEQTEDRKKPEKAAQTFVKPPKDWILLGIFFRYLIPYWKLVFLSLIAIPFAVGATLMQPWLIIRIVDDYVMVSNLEGLYQMAFLLAATVVIGYIGDAIYTYALQKAGLMGISDMRKELFAHVMQLPRIFYDHNPVGVILTRLTSDMEALGESMAVGVLSILTDIVKTLALFILLLYISWKLTLVILLLLPVIYVISNFLRSKLRYYYNQTREALADSTGFLQECLNGVKTVQLYAAETKVIRRYKEKTREFLKAQTRSNFYDASLFSIIEGITSISLGLMIWYGSGQILAGFITIGILIGFINTLNRIFIPIRQFTQQISAIQRALAALEHIHRLFQEPPEDTVESVSTAHQETLREFQELRFNNVYFRYSSQGPDILKGVTFQIKKGDRLALVGTTGSGKSTIVRILTKNYTNYQGSITINGVELSDIPRAQLDQLIAMMQQDVYLFNESIAFNIGLHRPGIGKKEVQAAAEYVYAHSFIEQLPGDYDFPILDNGKNLSAGQAQLVSFARAIAGSNEMIILDEATSSVDSVTENLIQKATEKVFQEKTVIAIAHRLSTIQHSDLILVMQEGKIAERGTHQELINTQGLYANLLKSLETEGE